MGHNCTSIIMSKQEHIMEALNVIKRSIEESKKIIDCSVSTVLEYTPFQTPAPFYPDTPDSLEVAKLMLVDITFKVKLIP